jgi:hypothetical protein
MSGPTTRRRSDATSFVGVAEQLLRSGPVEITGVSDPTDPDRDLYETGALLPGPHATLAGQHLRSGSTPRPDVRRGSPRNHQGHATESALGVTGEPTGDHRRITPTNPL